MKEGTNYCAKYIQTSAATSEAKEWTATIEWIAMPTATHDDVEAAIKTTTFADLFDSETCLTDKSGAGADGVCPTAGFTSVNTGGYGCECLKVKPGKEALAGTLEKRRYAGVSESSYHANLSPYPAKFLSLPSFLPRNNCYDVRAECHMPLTVVDCDLLSG